MSNQEKPDEGIDFRDYYKKQYAAEQKRLFPRKSPAELKAEEKEAKAAEEMQVKAEEMKIKTYEKKLRRDTEIQEEAKARVKLKTARELHKIQTAGKIPWNSSPTEFAVWIDQAWGGGKKWIKADTITGAFRIALICFHVIDPETQKPTKPRNLQQLLNQRNKPPKSV
jgi:hypothetical protein